MHEILHSRRFRDRRESVMVVIYLVRIVGGGHHDDDVTFRRRAEGVVRKYTRIYWT